MRIASQTDSQTANLSKLKLYGSIIMILLLLILAITFFPKGTKLNQCLGIFLTSNKDSCLLSLAYSTSNQSVCSYITDSNLGSCYSNIALKTNSAALCANAGSASDDANCVGQIANSTSNPSACTALLQPYADSCTMGVAVHMSDISTCQLITNQSSSTACSSAINLKRAALTLNSTECLSVSNSTNRSIVLPVLSADQNLFSSNNRTSVISLLSGYSFMQQNYTARDLCYVLIASDTHNPTLCSQTSSYAQGVCNYASYQNYTTPNQSYSQLISDCNSMSQYGTKCSDYVQLSEAIATKNLTICAGFSKNLSYQCYSSIAAQYNNATYCTYISNSTANNACVLQLNYSG